MRRAPFEEPGALKGEDILGSMAALNMIDNAQDADSPRGAPLATFGLGGPLP